MSLSVGIVGLPNAGKSTLFNALLKSDLAQVAKYPFTTIEPNVGVVEVPDERLDQVAEIEHCDKAIPTTIKFVDIAGLIKGAAEGEGLGNKFLAHIREVDAIALVARFFSRSDVVHPAGRLDPKGDVETIITELILADLDLVSRRTKAEKDPSIRSQLDRLEKKLAAGKPAGSVEIPDLNLLTAKPMIYVLNVDEDKATDDPADLIEEANLPVKPESAVVISARLESDLAKLPTGDQKEFLTEYGLREPGLNRLVKTAYHTLDLISYFTTESNQTHAWAVRKGTKAPAAAGTIHTDFASKFIKAEVADYEDFIQYGGWTKAKAAGRVRLEGKQYVIQDGDVCFFKVGV